LIQTEHERGVRAVTNESTVIEGFTYGTASNATR